VTVLDPEGIDEYVAGGVKNPLAPEQWSAFKHVLQAIGDTGVPLNVGQFCEGCATLGVALSNRLITALALLLYEAKVVHLHFEVGHNCSLEPLFCQRFSVGYVSEFTACDECGTRGGFLYDLMIGWPFRPRPMMRLREAGID